MDNQLTWQVLISPSQCDSSARLGVPDTFALFMDLATAHADALGIGAPQLMPQGLFWLTVKTRVRFFRRPAMGETVTAATWPEAAERIRCNRDYTIHQGDTLLCAGKTEWAVVEIKTGHLTPAREIYPPKLTPRPDTVWDEPFSRIRDDFTQLPFARYTVRSTDIDLGGHMNNVAYVRALAGAFSTAQWQEMDIREMEVHFKSPCYEGDTLDIQRREENGATELRMSVEGKTVVLARIL